MSFTNFKFKASTLCYDKCSFNLIKQYILKQPLCIINNINKISNKKYGFLKWLKVTEIKFGALEKILKKLYKGSY